MGIVGEKVHRGAVGKPNKVSHSFNGTQAQLPRNKQLKDSRLHKPFGQYVKHTIHIYIYIYVKHLCAKVHA